MRTCVPPVLGVLLHCSLCSVFGLLTSELHHQSTPAVQDISVPTLTKNEEGYLSTDAVVRRNKIKGTSTWKEHEGLSGSLATYLEFNDRKGIDQDMVFGEQTEHFGARNRVLGLSSELLGQSKKADFPCPVEADIVPCVCYLDADNNIDLDCTAVESEEQLANVFQQEFPFKALRGFNMSENSDIRVLDNVLNGISFTSIDLSPGPFALEAISDYFLLSIKETLSSIDIFASQLTSSQFPYAILDEMTKIDHVHIHGSQITWMPKILLPNVTVLYFDNGLTDYIEEGTFPVYADAMILGIQSNVVETVEPGSFFFVDENSITSNEDLTIIVSYNHLTILEAGTLPMRNGNTNLDLSGNQITSVAPGAFVLPEQTDQLTIVLDLSDNQLTTVDEETFRELMPFMTTLYFYENPLTCGCDVAWLVTNVTYMAKIDPGSTCKDGDTNLHDLDPDEFNNNCL